MQSGMLCYFLVSQKQSQFCVKTLNLNDHPIYTSNEDTKSQLFLLRNESAERTGKTCEWDLNLFCFFAILTEAFLKTPKIKLFFFLLLPISWSHHFMFQTCITSVYVDRATISLSKKNSSNHIDNTSFEEAIMQGPVVKMWVKSILCC